MGDGDGVDAVGAVDDEGGEDGEGKLVTAVAARDGAWSGAGDADGDAGSDDEDARSHARAWMKCGGFRAGNRRTGNIFRPRRRSWW